MGLRKLAVMVVMSSAAAWLLAFSGASASAAPVYGFERSFGSFGNVEGLVADSSTGDLYVYDASEGGKVYRFDSTGNPVEFSSTGSNAISGVGSSPFGAGETQLAVDMSAGATKGDIYVANAGNVRIYGPDGKSLGELNGSVSSEVPGAPWGEPCGVAVDSQGHVYVGLYGGGSTGSAVNKYTPTGSSVVNTDYTASLVGLDEICNVAADSEGSVYTVMWPNGPIRKYEAMQFGALQAQGALISSEGHAPSVDLSSDYLFADTGSKILAWDAEGNQRVNLDSSGEPESSFGNSQGVVANGATGELYVSDNANGRLVVFGSVSVIPDASTKSPSFKGETAILKGTVNPNGLQTSCHFEYGTETSYGHVVPCAQSPGSGSSPVEVSAEVNGLRPGTGYHYRLVAESANGASDGRDVSFLLQVPFVAQTWSVGVKVAEATIQGSLNPMGHDTTVRVEYGLDTSYGASVPASGVDAGSGTKVRTVEQVLTGLQPGTAYHYRVVATNEYGAVYGPDGSFTTFELPPAQKVDSCPNAAYRVGAAANLPDCRAYEMVSPVDKNGSDVDAQGLHQFVASDSGERVEFGAHTEMADSHGSGAGGISQYVATRGAKEWSTKAITPEVAPSTGFDPENLVTAFSEELDRAVTLGYDLPGVSGAMPSTNNLYLEDLTTAQLLEPITRDESSEPFNAFAIRFQLHLSGASSDLGVVTFELPVNLLPQASGSAPKLYAMDHGTLRIAGVLPDGSLPAGGSSRVRAEAKLGAATHKDTVSADGSRILFMSPAEGSGRQLYMRKNATETVWISQPESSQPASEPANVQFQTATPDDRHVLFTTDTPLLDVDPGGPGTALYMYTDSGKPETESNLTFIGRVQPASYGEEDKVVKAVSPDGSHVYFMSQYIESLPFQAAESGLFLWQDGDVRQIAPVAGGEFDANPEEEASVSLDGKKLVFMNARPVLPNLTILNLEGVSKVGTLEHAYPNSELYLYDEDAGTLKCVTCPPTGAAITAGVEVRNVYAAVSAAGFEIAARPRYFSRNGRYVFFNTVEALVPQDTNNLTDAYEYNLETGKLSLLSPGTGEYETWFVEASPDGRDAFLVTREQLKRQDVDKLVDVYDARVEGGQPEPPPPGTPCAGDACQGTPSAAPAFNTASAFTGRGNPSWQGGAKATLKHRSLSRAQKLKRALKACQRRPRRKRAVCRARARKRYAAKKSAKRAVR